MFRPRPMLRIDILVLQRDLAKIVGALVKAGIFHLAPLADLPSLPASEKERRELDEDRLLELEQTLVRLTQGLRVHGGPSGILESDDLDKWKDWAAPLVRILTALETRTKQLNHLKIRLDRFIHFLENVSKVKGNIEEINNLRFSFLVVGELPAAVTDAGFNPPAGIECQMLAREENSALVAFFGRRTDAPRLAKFLERVRFRTLVLPQRVRGEFSSCLKKAAAVRKRVDDNLKRLDQKRLRLAERYGPTLFQRLHTIRIRRSMLNIYRDCGFTDRVAMVAGWIPGHRLPDLKNVLDEVAPGRYTLHQQPARGVDTPVLLSNPKLIRPFERILSVYGTPSYGELEPTPLLALGFLVLFGMMFGDLGHGIVFVLAGICLRRFSRYRDEGCILTEMGVFAALFGGLYGSVFGLENIVPALWFNPMNDIPKFMGVALLAGAGLILTGLLLGVWNRLRQPDPSLFTDPFGLAGLVLYGGAIGTGLLVYHEHLPATFLLWLVLPLTAIFLHPLASGKWMDGDPGKIWVLLAEGLVEILETVLGLLANTVSFLRVAAFGLAHIGLLMAVFAIADQVRSWPLWPFWVGLIHLAGNLVVLILEGLVVSIQTVRLEFYELFSKFFQGGGVVYRPLDPDHLPERSR